jgi:hypothetical protein
MAFGSYDPTVATVNPAIDSISPYSTTVTGVAPGKAAIWATATLSDGRFCQASGSTDCDINVPAPTQCSTPVPVDPPTALCAPVSGTSIITWQWNAVSDTSAGPGKYATDYEVGIYNSSGVLVNIPNNNTWQPASAFGCSGGGVCQWPTPLPAGTYYSLIRARGTCLASALAKSDFTLPVCIGTLYTVSGKLFNDTNRNGKSVADGDINYSGTFTVSSFPAAGVTYPGNGTYQISNLPEGQYTVTFGGLDASHSFTYPPSSSLIVSVGSSCYYPVTSEAKCASGDTGNNCTSSGTGCSGNLTGLNAGVVDNTVSGAIWIQTTGADLRLDKGTFVNLLPPATYTSIPFVGGMPGIVFSGKSTPSFGLGQASITNWIAGSPLYPEVFTDTHSIIPTSYTFLTETAQSSNIIPTPLSSVTSSLGRGIYITGGDLTINSPVDFGTGNFIILVNGNLNINARITVPVGSTLVFSVKGDITVNKTLGEAASSTSSTIEGLYSADHDFIADGNNNCPASDLRLNVAGSVIANAGRGGGVFVNRRSLCTDNSSYPSVSFIERPDFMLNYPSFVRQIPRAWQELAP